MVNLDGILEEWRAYKMSVPTYGAVILNNCLDKVLLVQVRAVFFSQDIFKLIREDIDLSYILTLLWLAKKGRGQR